MDCWWFECSTLKKDKCAKDGYSILTLAANFSCFPFLRFSIPPHCHVRVLERGSVKTWSFLPSRLCSVTSSILLQQKCWYLLLVSNTSTPLEFCVFQRTLTETWSKASVCNMGDGDSIPRLGRSPGEGKGYPLQYSGLENSKDHIVHGFAKSRTWLSDFHFTSLHKLKAMVLPCSQLSTSFHWEKQSSQHKQRYSNNAK